MRQICFSYGIRRWHACWICSWEIPVAIAWLFFVEFGQSILSRQQQSGQSDDNSDCNSVFGYFNTSKPVSSRKENCFLAQFLRQSQTTNITFTNWQVGPIRNAAKPKGKSILHALKGLSVQVGEGELEFEAQASIASRVPTANLAVWTRACLILICSLSWLNDGQPVWQHMTCGVCWRIN